MNLLELVSAYAPFANGGSGVLAYGITEISDTAGHVLYRRSGSGPGQVIPPDEVALMDGLLAGVIARGTGKAAALPRPVAGKTGTTQDYKDAWFIGFTADLVAGVWLGNDDNTPMNKVTGGSLPAPVWKNFMLAATQGMPVKPLAQRAVPGDGSRGCTDIPCPDSPCPGIPRHNARSVVRPGRAAGGGNPGGQRRPTAARLGPSARRRSPQRSSAPP